jgi:hypothetical protein
MCEVVEIQLEWKYTPESYLEESILINGQGYELSISDGIAFAKIDPSVHSQNPKIKENLSRLIENRLQAVQIITHRDFSLDKPRRFDLRKDGKKNIFLEIASPEIWCFSMQPLDLVQRDKNGNILSDTKQERRDKQKWLSEAITKYRVVDFTLDQMLKSYQMSVKDPRNELVHLYEIRDALSAKFGKRKNAQKRLGINNKEWEVLGDLANIEPLEVGRHRGKATGILRPATTHELEIARKNASNLIEKYLTFLEADPKADRKD